MKNLFKKQWYISTENGMMYYRNIYFLIFPVLPIAFLAYFWYNTL
jgi:hypothetical protein